MDFIFRAAEAFLKKHKRLQRYRRVFAFLAAVVVFATTYELILPAITMDRRRAAETPGVEIGVAAEGLEETEEILETEETAEEQNTEGETIDSTPSGETASDKTEETDSSDAPDASNASDYTSEESDEDVSDIVETDSAGETASNSDGSLMEGESTKDTTENSSGSEASDTASDAAIVFDGIGSEDQAAVSAENATGTGEEILSTEEILTDPVQLTFEAPDRSYLITATFDETAALPADVSLNAVEILSDTQYKDAEDNLLYADYIEYFEKTVDTLEKAGRLADTYVSSARFFDITFTGADGQPVEPAAPVNIAVKYNTEVLSAKDTDETLAVHFDDVKIEDRKDADLPEIGKAEVIETENQVKKDKIEEITFAAQKFSVYGLAATETLKTKVLTANGDTYEICVSYNQKAEIPEGAKLEAYELMPGTDEYEECVAKSANTDENGQTASRFFNISIIVDGAEYEPKAPVDVRITLKDTSPEEVAADKDITHFTNAGEVESIPQEVEGSSEGGAEVSFQMDSFSTVEVPLLGAGSTPTYTISVGGTKEINGTESSSTNSWSSSDETIATVSNSSTNTATVTGVKAGTATITHTYYVKKKFASEKFTINVEAASGEITETADASDGNVTVSVKRTGSTKKLEGSTLVVEKLTSGTDFEEYAQALTDNGGDVSALKGMYHIYLTDSNGDEVTVSNANMEVTITDPALTGLNNVNVGHFKKNNSGAIESKGFTNEESIVFKKYSVSDNSLTIKIQNFSVITIDESETESESINIVTTHTAGGYDGDEIRNDDTSRQIDYAYESYFINGSGITKTIEPTNIENIFKVNVTISKKASIELLQEYFQNAAGYVLQDNGSHSGANVKGSLGTYSCHKHDYKFHSTDQGTYSIEVRYRVGSETFSVQLYAGANANEGTYHKIIVPLPNGQWLNIHQQHMKKVIDFRDELPNGIDMDLTSIANTIYTALSSDYVLVENTLNSEDFEYLGADINGSRKEQSITGKNNVITATAPVNGKMTINGANNIASGNTDSFSYYVRLRTDYITEMEGVGRWPNPLTGSEHQEGELYAKLNAKYVEITETVNDYSRIENLSYVTKSKEKEFEIIRPSVSGELYFIELEKVDSEISTLKLPNAEFELRDGDGNVKATLKTDSNGKAVSEPGVPYGVYALYETKTPDGYTLTDSENGDLVETYPLGYLGDSSRTDWVHDQLSDKKLGKLLTGTAAVTNTSNEVELTLNKAGSDETSLSADFTFVSTPKSGGNSISETITISSGQKITIKGNYTYSLTEIEAPSGYQSVGTLNIYLTKDDTGNPVIQIGNDKVSLTQNGNKYIAEYTIIDPLDKVTFNIQKLDSNNNPLGGAEFAIYKWSGTDPAATAVDGYDALISISTEGSTKGFLAPNGTGSSDMELSPGTYALRETNVPEGYVAPAGDWKLEVTSTGVSVYAYNRELNNGEGGYSNSPDYTYTLREPVTVTNNPGRSLPSSGGSGTFIYKIGAMAFIALALITSYTLRQRERRYKN